MSIVSISGDTALRGIPFVLARHSASDNPAVIDELAHPDIRFEYSLHQPLRGRDAVRQFAADFRAAFPDLAFGGTADPAGGVSCRRQAAVRARRGTQLRPRTSGTLVEAAGGGQRCSFRQRSGSVIGIVALV